MNNVLILICALALTNAQTPCQTAAESAPRLLGSYVPQCEEDGSFKLRQCHGSTGYCWCVSADGAEMLGTRRSPSELALDCARLPTCLVEAHKARQAGLIGSFVPQCDSEGNYESRQCHGSTGHCWCTSEDGREILGTKRGPAQQQFDCEALPECLRASHAARLGAAPGTFIPQCNADGSYAAQQCHHSTGHCWCVSPSNGAEIMMTRRGPAETQMDCEHVPECLQTAHEARSSRLLGAFVPQCDEQTGDFLAQQCHASTGHCWCVASGKEIIGTRTTASDNLRFDCEAVPECFMTAHVARSAGGIGRFVPQCEEDGSYSLQQCRGSTGTCWCVAGTDGKEIQGTRRGPTEPRVDCSQVPKCLLEAHESRANAGLGSFIAQCNADGSYAVTQSHGSTGHSWCVDSEGVEIENTRRGPTEPKLDCDHLPACLRAAHDAQTPRKLLGRYVPQCDAETGNFAAQQCHGSTGHCWCVIVDSGVEVLGTRRGPSESRFDCTALPTCLQSAHEARSAGLVGSFVPQCEADGSFLETQCHGSSGHCWCVDENGAEIESTRRGPSEPRMDCKALPECVKASHAARLVAAIGSYVPQCDADGSFASTQCHGSSGHCWCVDERGKEMDGTRRSATEDRMDCEEVPECLAAAHAARSLGVKGSFVPRCNVDGSYASQQCHGSTGHCWCVSRDGQEIDGTRTRAGTPSADCDHLPKCFTDAHAARSRNLLGSFVPQCEQNGAFAELQCHGSTGHCWCADPATGKEVLGSRRTASEGVPECSAPLTECQVQAQRARASGLLGAYVPQCSESDGKFLPKQCHGSTGSCWCADEKGGEILGTRSSPATFDSLFQCTQLPACLVSAHAARGRHGSYVPQCDADGKYSKVQCHTSTGYCWCATADGQEVEGTRTRFDQPDCSDFKYAHDSADVYYSNTVTLLAEDSSSEKASSSSSTGSSGSNGSTFHGIAYAGAGAAIGIALAVGMYVIFGSRKSLDSVQGPYQPLGA